MQKKTINKLIEHLEKAIELNISMAGYIEKFKLYPTFFSNKKKDVNVAYEKGELGSEDFERVMNLYNQLKNKKVKTSSTEASGTGEVSYIRNEDGQIVEYKFMVPLRDKPPFRGSLTRDEMNMIHRMYSYYGSSITQREISRSFPEYSLEDFKKILRVFNITKASVPFAPHIIEENSQEDLQIMQLREKENDFLRGIEVQRVRNNENLLKKYALENADLKDKLNTQENLLKGLNLDKVEKWNPRPCDYHPDRDIIIWLSDMHVGAYISKQSIYQNPYSAKDIQDRLNMILARIRQEECVDEGFRKIIICNLGDSLDGYNRQTTRGGHELPQCMNNKEQLHTFISCMSSFFKSLQEDFRHEELLYYCVGESNHDGDYGYAANVALSAILEQQGIEATVFESFIGSFEVQNTKVLLCHGKDTNEMFKNMPLTLDIKTENFINEYLDNKGITGKVLFVKGDLHQSATTYGKRFTYKSVGSLFGSSEWIHKNFGNSPWSCDYSILQNNNLLDGRVVG